MSRFFRERGLGLVIVIGVSVIISLLQGGMSYSVRLGALRDRFNVDAPLLASLHWLARAGLLVLAGTLWMLKLKRAMFRVIIVTNSFFTVVLLYDATFLLSMLSGSNSRTAATVLADVALMAASNILIFSIWYWIIDPPGVIEGEDAHQAWAFLFPQRGSPLPGYESWVPRYIDYLFICLHDQLCVQPDGCVAADANREDADDGSGRHFGRHADRHRRCGDQYPGWEWLTEGGRNLFVVSIKSHHIRVTRS